MGHAGARLQPRKDGAARLIVDADQCDFGLRHQPFLDRRVARKVAMPIEMVGRYVDQESHAGRKRGRKIDLIGRTLDDMDPPCRGGRQIENRHADVAAHRDFAPGLLQHMGDERRGGRFAIGAGDRDKRRAWRPGAALTDKEFDVADDWNPRGVRKIDGPVRLWVGQRHTRRKHKHPEISPVGMSEIDERDAPVGGALASGRAVVPGGHFGAAGDQRPRGRQPRAAKAEESDALPAQGLDRRHHHLSFSEARPTIASTKAMIQKRMTICGSDQPSCSKW